MSKKDIVKYIIDEYGVTSLFINCKNFLENSPI